MITILFGFAGEKILVTIKGERITFANTTFGAVESDIEGLQLNLQGVIKEFPDLKDNDNWKAEAVKRFKEKISSLKTEQDRAVYIMEDLEKHGYKAEKIQREGFRPTMVE